MPGSLLKSARMPLQNLIMTLRARGDMDMKNMFDTMDLSGMYESVKKNLQIEGADVLLQAIKQKLQQQGAAGGGAGMPSADMLQRIAGASAQGAQPSGAPPIQ